jgi:acyl-CoA thioesterase FadM
MARVKIELPEKFSFEIIIPIRITDLNYGNHVGNDTILSILHEARVQYLEKFGYGELNFGGVGLIMSDVAIEFKNELFYGEKIIASVSACEFSKFAFEVYYKLEKEPLRHPDNYRDQDGKRILAVTAKTGMICYDYQNKKIVAIPEEVRERLQ